VRGPVGLQPRAGMGSWPIVDLQQQRTPESARQVMGEDDASTATRCRQIGVSCGAHAFGLPHNNSLRSLRSLRSDRVRQVRGGGALRTRPKALRPVAGRNGRSGRPSLRRQAWSRGRRSRRGHSPRPPCTRRLADVST
jgi:hypothetical protein